MNVLIAALESGHQQFVDRTLAKKSHTTWSTTLVRVTLEFDVGVNSGEFGVSKRVHNSISRPVRHKP